MSRSKAGETEDLWPVSPIPTSWDDLLEDIESPEAWAEKRKVIKQQFHDLMLNDAAPEPPSDPDVKVEKEIDRDGFRILYISYKVESDERAHAYLAIPDGTPPEGGYPGVVCLHGTTTWGARRTLGLPPEPGDPQADKAKRVRGMGYGEALVRRGYVTISPEHFCCAKRMPAEGPFETAAFYRKHPKWSAVGKYMHDSKIACSVLAARPEVDADRLGVTGHSLGGHGSVWLAACDERIRCASPSCGGGTFRENPLPLNWSREEWYVYLPQLREDILAGRRIVPDLHEIMASIAPRALLDRFALNDGLPLAQAHKVMLHVKVHEVYRLLGAEGAHAFYVFADGHSVTDQSRECLLSWMDRWLKYDGEPQGSAKAPYSAKEAK